MRDETNELRYRLSLMLDDGEETFDDLSSLIDQVICEVRKTFLFGDVRGVPDGVDCRAWCQEKVLGNQLAVSKLSQDDWLDLRDCISYSLATSRLRGERVTDCVVRPQLRASRDADGRLRSVTVLLASTSWGDWNSRVGVTVYQDKMVDICPWGTDELARLVCDGVSLWLDRLRLRLD